MCDGYIKLSRKIVDWEWITDNNTLVVWIHILLRANWADSVWKGTPIKRGTFITSRAHFAKECNLTERQVRTAFSHLQMTGEVTIESNSKYSVITVNNYDLYQSNDQVNVRQGVQQPTKYRPSTDQVPTTREEEKESNNKKKKNIYGAYKHIRLTSEEHSRLAEEFGEAVRDKAIEIVDQYCQESGKTYKDYNLTIRRWGIAEAKKQMPKQETHRDYYSQLYLDVIGATDE